jgi:hypothetical protein
VSSISLGIVIKGPEGIVLAADSRVTLTAQIPGQNLLLPATFDNATKLLKVNGQEYVGAVTFGLGAIGQTTPRTAHSFLPEFEAKLHDEKKERLSVAEFAKELSDFFMAQWAANMPKDYAGPPLVFLVGGYDKDAPYGRTFEIILPSNPAPKEWHENEFGPVWGGQKEFTDRLLQGYDPQVKEIIKKELNLTAEQSQKLEDAFKPLTVQIPYPFLSLQDCVDLSIFLIRTTMNIQTWQIGIRGVGGAIDVATITRIRGFEPVQLKTIKGEMHKKDDD